MSARVRREAAGVEPDRPSPLPVPKEHEMTLPSALSPVESEVRPHRGAPTLFVNGAPHTGLTYFYGDVLNSAVDIRAFAEAGVHLFSGCFGATVFEDGTYDFSTTDTRMDYVLEANPKALILPRVGVTPWRVTPVERDRHPEEMRVNVPMHGGEPVRDSYSFASRLWRRRGETDLTAFIEHCERKYGAHIVGYHIAAGAMGEWAYSWLPMFSDYGEAQRQAFREWLHLRYAGDVGALRAAWGRPDAAFETADVPPPERRRRAPGQSCLLDTAADRDVSDYLTFHSAVVAEAAAHFCGVAKRALRSLGRRKVVGVFYGYHFKNLNKPANFHNAGHFAQEPVLHSPDVDFVCAPYCYQGREHGHMHLAQLVAGTVRLHEKLYWCEEDTFTFLANRERGRARCPDRETTIGVFRRNLMGILRDGGTAWWMDFGSPGHGPQVRGWYRDEGLMRNFAWMQQFAARRLNAGDHSATAQVAVFVSDESGAYQRQDAALMDALVMRQMFEIAALGASFDTYRVADLSRLFAQPSAARYRLLVFIDALWLSQAERRALKEAACRDGRTILWAYAAGLVTDAGLSAAAMADATGIRVRWRTDAEAVMVNTSLTGTRLLYGSERELSPVLYGEDADATVHGWLLNGADPALLEKRFADWRSIWSAAPAVPAAILRRFAAEAGVHLYVETGEQVIAERGYLAVHGAFDGVRTVRLPVPSVVREAESSRLVGEGVSSFEARLRRGETGIWEIDEGF
jgi:hypothetical protein